MFSFVVEDGTGLDNATSYVSVDEADAYQALNAYGSAWTGYTEARKQSGLVNATQYIDITFNYRGTRLRQEQRLEFPRTYSTQDVYDIRTPIRQINRMVPRLIKEATIVLAGHVLSSNIETLVNAEGGSSGESGQLRSLSVGGLSLGLSGSTTPQTNRQIRTLVTNTVGYFLTDLRYGRYGVVRLNNA